MEFPQRTAKAVRDGTHRAEALTETLQRVSPLAAVMGITRVANVTGLDSLGIPVVMVCRPNSRSVAVSQGKGIDLLSARVSGLMESAELYHAETTILPLRLGSYEELRYQHRVIDVDELPRESSSRFHSNLRLLWCEGRDLIDGEAVFVPYEMVHTNYTTPLPDGHGCFPASSNGLASGNNLIEAISHGICELIERDAATLARLRIDNGLENAQLDLDSIDDPNCQRLLSRFRNAGLSVSVWDITSDIEIATFACFIVPESDGEIWHPAAAVGHGCHPSRHIALTRALTEAAQARLTVISGLRDDFDRETYNELLDLDIVRTIRRRSTASSSCRHFYDVPHHDFDTLEEDVAWELNRLRDAGIHRVIVIDLTKPEFELPVVRVVVPGLEPILNQGYNPGPRARRLLAAAL